MCVFYVHSFHFIKLYQLSVQSEFKKLHGMTHSGQMCFSLCFYVFFESRVVIFFLSWRLIFFLILLERVFSEALLLSAQTKSQSFAALLLK